jgi:hypothetical protein
MSSIIFNQGADSGGDRGIVFSFANGVMVSIQAHKHSSSKRDPKDSDGATLVEVAALYDDGEFATNDVLGRKNDEENDIWHNDVLGYQTPDQVLEFMVKCAALPSEGGAR